MIVALLWLTVAVTCWTKYVLQYYHATFMPKNKIYQDTELAPKFKIVHSNQPS